jgi:hypothetical protein
MLKHILALWDIRGMSLRCDRHCIGLACGWGADHFFRFCGLLSKALISEHALDAPLNKCLLGFFDAWVGRVIPFIAYLALVPLGNFYE